MEEEADPRRLVLAAHQLGDVEELIVLHPDEVLLAAVREDAVGELLVDLEIGVPEGRVEIALPEQIVEQRPEDGVREPFVEAVDLLLREEDRHQLVAAIPGSRRRGPPASRPSGSSASPGQPIQTPPRCESTGARALTRPPEPGFRPQPPSRFSRTMGRRLETTRRRCVVGLKAAKSMCKARARDGGNLSRRRAVEGRCSRTFRSSPRHRLPPRARRSGRPARAAPGRRRRRRPRDPAPARCPAQHSARQGADRDRRPAGRSGWEGAARVDTFYETNPGDNIEPKVKTVAWLTYDDHFFYAAFDFSDPDPEEHPGAARRPRRPRRAPPTTAGWSSTPATTARRRSSSSPIRAASSTTRSPTTPAARTPRRTSTGTRRRGSPRPAGRSRSASPSRRCATPRRRCRPGGSCSTATGRATSATRSSTASCRAARAASSATSRRSPA